MAEVLRAVSDADLGLYIPAREINDEVLRKVEQAAAEELNIYCQLELTDHLKSGKFLVELSTGQRVIFAYALSENVRPD